MKYNVGLNLSDSAIGWAVMDEKYHLVTKKGKTLIGVRNFEKGVSAADKREARSNRRRVDRTRWRIQLLNQLMKPYLKKEDPEFLERLQNSNRTFNDPNRNFRHAYLFPNSEQKYREQYPTIYHLRYALMKEDHKFSVKEIYLGLHHIIKYRGNFLFTFSNNKFDLKQLDLKKPLTQLIELMKNNGLITYTIKDYEKAQSILLAKDLNKTDKKKELSSLFEKKQPEIIERNTQKALVSLLSGGKTDLVKLLQLDLEEPFKLSLDEPTALDDVEEFKSECDTNSQEILVSLIKVWNTIQLNKLFPNGKTISLSMIEKYVLHRKQLKVMRSLWKSNKKLYELRQTYEDYLNNVKQSNYNVKETLYHRTLKILQDTHNQKADQIRQWIANDEFLPKQRENSNQIIPNQAHLQELNDIIDNQSKYYPWLLDIKEKLNSIMTFKIPYYVGPLMENKNTSRSKYSWMVRKEPGKIYPWNFDKKVDLIRTSEAFIRKSIGYDSYLLSEKVLPKKSILYQAFSVLNELNGIKIDGRPLPNGFKQKVFQLFKSHKTVTKKMILDLYKKCNSLINTPEIEGLKSESKCSTSLSSYLSMKKIFGNKVDDIKYQKDVDLIIEYLAVFEERDIFVEKVKRDVKWISEDELEKVKHLFGNLEFKGWGRLSRTMLLKLRDQNHQNVMDLLWNSNKNFNSIITIPKIQAQIEEYSQKVLKNDTLDDVLDREYCSAVTKKMIHQMINLLSDITKIMKSNPDTISLVSLRTSGQSNYTYSLLKQLRKNENLDYFKPGLSKELEQLFKKKENLNDEKTALYFMQGGRDVYTGKVIDYNDLKEYQIDYIVSPEILEDERLSNKVLTKKPQNLKKKITNIVKEIGKIKFNDLNCRTLKDLWNKLFENKLITKTKYLNLMTDPDNLDPYRAKGIVTRNLIQVSQAVKVAAKILNERFTGTKIIEVRDQLIQRMRNHFEFIKNTNMNDYHFGFDAYLATFIGRYLYERYPKLRGYFIYGEYMQNMPKPFYKKMSHLNVLHDLYDTENHIIVQPYSGEVIMDSNDALNELQKAYHFKYMNVTKELKSYENGELYNQTIYKANYHADKQRKLIPIKKDKPTAMYGGYSSEKVGYLILIKLNDGKEETYRLVKMPIRYINELSRMEQNEYNKKLHEIVESQLSVKESKNYEIILDKVKLNQEFIDGKIKFTARTANYKCNEAQLVLKQSSLKTLNKKVATSEEYDAVYDDILKQVNRYFPLYDFCKGRKKLNEGRALFHELSMDPNDATFKKYVLNNIMIGLHADTSGRIIKPLKINSSLGSIQDSKGIKLSKNAVIVYKSATGFYENKVPLENLKARVD